MVTINTLNDINKMRHDRIFKKELIDEIEEYFKELVHELTGTNAWETYSLEKDGAIIVLEPEDDISSLEAYGFMKEDGQYTAPIEFVIDTEIGGDKYFKTVIVCNNSYANVIYHKGGQFGEEFDRWIEEFLTF